MSKPVANRRAPDPRRAKVHYTYTVAEAAKLFGVSRATIRNWLKAGLEFMRSGRTVLILGESLRAFLEGRRKSRRTKTPAGHMYCFGCRAPRQPAEGMTELVDVRGGSGNVRALCDCGALMHRRVSLSKLAEAGTVPRRRGSSGSRSRRRFASTIREKQPLRPAVAKRPK